MLRMYENVPVKVYYKSKDSCNRHSIYETNPKLTFSEDTIKEMLFQLMNDFDEE
jgi:hypothetical protein